MGLSKRDTEFRLSKISYLDFKHIEMDRVLTEFFARLWHNGYPSRLTRNFELNLKTFVDYALEHPEWFTNFDQNRLLLEEWMKTHLMDLVNRGNPAKEAIAAPRPLHGFTYRLRNSNHCRAYNADQHLFEMLYFANGGNEAIEQLKKFFFSGIDLVTHNQNQEAIDVETQALLHLPVNINDAPNTTQPRDQYPPLCRGSANLLAEDVKRLLFYQRFIPRSVMVDYLKILFAFHLGLYHLRLFKLLPELVRRQGMVTQTNDPYPIGLFLDVANHPGTPVATLAEYSADIHYRRIPNFVKAYYEIRKLDEFASHLAKQGKLGKAMKGDYPIQQLLSLLGSAFKSERDPYFKMRLAGLLEDSGGSSEELDLEIQEVIDMALPPFETYIESLVAVRGNSHRQSLVKCLDSLLLKNRPGAVLGQPKVRDGKRRFILDSRLLEVLLQIAVLRPGGALGFHSGNMRIDELTTSLQKRYGLYIDRLPPNDGFGKTSITHQQALRNNLEAFKSRLREVGFYRDLSDAYVTQTVTPRYRIGLDGFKESA